jgi:hypothetical protein
LVPVIDIHDTHLTVKDVFTVNGQRSLSLYTTLPQAVADFVNNTNIRFNDEVEDAFVWSLNKNGVYSTKSGYKWLLSLSGSDTAINSPFSWSWIWHLRIPEKYKFLIWLACHKAVPTLSLLHHRNIASSSICSRCEEYEETLFHCFRDCSFSRAIWIRLGFNDPAFFAADCVADWLKEQTQGPQAITFSAGLWWTWRCRNSQCLSNETMSLNQLSLCIQNSVEDITTSFCNPSLVVPIERHVRWNNNNFDCPILNVDGSCIGNPFRAGFGGLIRNC